MGGYDFPGSNSVSRLTMCQCHFTRRQNIPPDFSYYIRSCFHIEFWQMSIKCGLLLLVSIIYRGYYMVARRYEFYFRVAKQYLTNERSEWVKYCFCHSKIKFISSSRRVMFFLLYRHADDGVFDDFPKISDHLPKIFQNCSEYQTNVSEYFPKISEDVRRFPKIAEDFRGRPEDVSMIHQRI